MTPVLPPLKPTDMFCPGHPIDAHPRLVQLQGEAARRFLFTAETTAAGLCQQDTEAVPQVGDVGEVDAQWKVQVKPLMAIGGGEGEDLLVVPLRVPPFKKNVVSEVLVWNQGEVYKVHGSTSEFDIVDIVNCDKTGDISSPGLRDNIRNLCPAIWHGLLMYQITPHVITKTP